MTNDERARERESAAPGRLESHGRFETVATIDIRMLEGFEEIWRDLKIIFQRVKRSNTRHLSFI
jgi:hypothetical protein